MASIYGDIVKIDITGASEVTAKQDKLTIKVCVNNYLNLIKKLAENDLARMEKYKSMITKVGRAKQMDPAVIAAIISRESRAGAALKNGRDPSGNGFGLMQVDESQKHTPVGAWDSEQHVAQATEILIGFIKEIKVKFPKWTQEQCFKGGIAAYNKGMSRVSTYENIDARTTGQDYSSD
ncbi:hypothetical protein cypCar_00015695, partial [Cyprinus carpio]